MDHINSIAVSTRTLRKHFGSNGARVEALRGVEPFASVPWAAERAMEAIAIR